LTAIHVAEEPRALVAHPQFALTIPQRLWLHAHFNGELAKALLACVGGAHRCKLAVCVYLRTTHRRSLPGRDRNPRPDAGHPDKRIPAGINPALDIRGGQNCARFGRPDTAPGFDLPVDGRRRRESVPQ
jgi:hypothetical protein